MIYDTKEIIFEEIPELFKNNKISFLYAIPALLLVIPFAIITDFYKLLKIKFFNGGKNENN